MHAHSSRRHPVWGDSCRVARCGLYCKAPPVVPLATARPRVVIRQDFGANYRLPRSVDAVWSGEIWPRQPNRRYVRVGQRRPGAHMSRQDADCRGQRLIRCGRFRAEYSYRLRKAKSGAEEARPTVKSRRPIRQQARKRARGSDYDRHRRRRSSDESRPLAIRTRPSRRTFGTPSTPTPEHQEGSPRRETTAGPSACPAQPFVFTLGDGYSTRSWNRCVYP